MWRRYLLSIFVWPFFAGSLHAQASFCEDETRTDSALNAISGHYSYTTRQYQYALDSFLARCPDNAGAWQMKAMPNIKLGNFGGSFRNLKNAVRLKPASYLPYQAFLKCIFSKDYRAALIDFEASERLMPGSGTMDHSFDFYRGLCYLCLYSLPQAKRFLGKDVAAQEKHGNLHHVDAFYMGLCYDKCGDARRAEKYYRESLKIYPQYPEPNYYLGLLLISQGRFTEANTFLMKAQISYREGYNSNEDQEFYVNYPFAVTAYEIAAALKKD